MNKNLMRYDQFIKENAPGITKPGETTTPAPTAPPKPKILPIVPTERPSVEDDPMARHDDLSMNHPATKPGETTTTPIAPPKPKILPIVPTERPSVEDDPMAYDKPASLEELHGMLGDTPEGAEIMGNVLNYRGPYQNIEVEVPSETGKYMVDGKDLKTNNAQKAYDYIQAQARAQTQEETGAQSLPTKKEDPENQAYSGKNEIVESKSYSKTRKFSRRTKK